MLEQKVKLKLAKRAVYESLVYEPYIEEVMYVWWYHTSVSLLEQGDFLTAMLESLKGDSFAVKCNKKVINSEVVCSLFGSIRFESY